MADENNDFKYYTGISFPFRLNNQGQLVTSSVNTFSAGHLNESIEQILHTSFGERVMEDNMYSDINSSLFNPNDISLQSYLASKIVEALELDERIVVDESGIEFPCCRAINDNGEDWKGKYSVDNLPYMDDENYLYEFCKNCDRYVKFNANWDAYKNEKELFL